MLASALIGGAGASVLKNLTLEPEEWNGPQHFIPLSRPGFLHSLHIKNTRTERSATRLKVDWITEILSLFQIYRILNDHNILLPLILSRFHQID